MDKGFTSPLESSQWGSGSGDNINILAGSHCDRNNGSRVQSATKLFGVELREVIEEGVREVIE